MVDYIWSALSALGTIVTIVVWARDDLKQKPIRLVYPLLVVLLTAMATYQAEENHKLKAIKKQGSALLATWPGTGEFSYDREGTNIGVILSGLSFLEEHELQFPETYRTATQLVKTRLNDFRPPQDSTQKLQDDFLIRDVAISMRQLVASIAK